MKLTSLLEGVALGAAFMYFYDPDRGNSRRAVLRDQTAAQLRRKREVIDVMTRDLSNRAQGLQHMAKHRFNNEPVSDEVLVERIRAEMGRHVTHPSSIMVGAENGHVTLSGPIFANEVQDFIRVVRFTPGVKSVDNNLDQHSSHDGVPGLQGEGHLPPKNGRWTPAGSLLGIGTGVLMAMYGMGRKGISGTLAQLLGAGMIAKGFHDTEHRFDPMIARETSFDHEQQEDGRTRAYENATSPVTSAEVL